MRYFAITLKFEFQEKEGPTFFGEKKFYRRNNVYLLQVLWIAESEDSNTNDKN